MDLGQDQQTNIYPKKRSGPGRDQTIFVQFFCSVTFFWGGSSDFLHQLQEVDTVLKNRRKLSSALPFNSESQDNLQQYNFRTTWTFSSEHLN